MASVFDELQIKYKGFTQSKDSETKSTIVIFQGSKELVDAAFDEKRIHSHDETYGTLQNMHVRQGEGPFRELECEFTIEYYQGVGNSAGTAYGPKASTLDCTMLSLPIESRSNYRMKWNNTLWSTIKGAATPGFWDTATLNADGITGTAYEYPGSGTPTAATYYAWGATQSELPSLPSPFVWYRVHSMTKPGVETYEKPVYTLAETSKANTQVQAQWILSKVAGKTGKPINGDFGIEQKFGGEWLCEGGSIRREGKVWLATLNWTWAPHGWDNDLYHDAGNEIIRLIPEYELDY
jgi:hypothetical protein